MLTEHINPRFVDLDSWSTSDMIEAMYDGQLTACAAVRPALPAINAAVDDAVSALKRGGRLVYVGAGTSGRIAIQDGAELGPTYDWPSDRIVFVMAGGMHALVQSVEGAEDNEAKGAEAIAQADVHQDDVVIAVAASGTTPFTVGALRSARARGALCIAVANNRGAPLFEPARHRILIETGTEVLAGSTRMQAGTAQKIVLNLILHSRHGQAGPGLSGSDGQHARQQRQAASPCSDHRQPDRGMRREGCRRIRSPRGGRRQDCRAAGIWGGSKPKPSRHCSSTRAI